MKQLRVRFCGFVLFLAALVLLPSCVSAFPAVGHDAAGTTTTFAVSSQTQVPGLTLPPGTYTIRIVDRLSDRMILEVTAPGGKHSTFLALPQTKLAIPAAGGPVIVNAATPRSTAVRGFKFADGTFAEFVYPKSEAVTLAKANSTTIPAVDPASEGRSPLPKLSHDDLQEITLWMLTPAPVGPGASGPGITAARYQAPPANEVASNHPVSSQPIPRARPHVAKPAVAVLPHTASAAPLLMLFFLSTVLLAGVLGYRRLRLA